jgi:hypothetical protein
LIWFAVFCFVFVLFCFCSWGCGRPGCLCCQPLFYMFFIGVLSVC